MVLLLFLALQQQATSPAALIHSEINERATNDFIRVMQKFRDWAAQAAPSGAAPPTQTMTDVLTNLGKREAGEQEAKASGFQSLEAWQTFGDLLLAALQQRQIANLVADAKARLKDTTESERSGLIEHISALERIEAELKLSRILSAAEQEFLTLNGARIAAMISGAERKP